MRSLLRKGGRSKVNQKIALSIYKGTVRLFTVCFVVTYNVPRRVSVCQRI
jgi:hypothetical protein